LAGSIVITLQTLALNSGDLVAISGLGVREDLTGFGLSWRTAVSQALRWLALILFGKEPPFAFLPL
jgi:hypothetical protein